MTNASDTSLSSDSSVPDWKAQAAADEKRQAELLARNKAALFDVLATFGVTCIIVCFDGYGDEGQIQNIEVKTADDVVAMPTGMVELRRETWGQPDPQHVELNIADAVETLVYDLLSQTHCGWQDGDGAYGDFTFDVCARSITLDYNERYTESEYTQHIF